jgi:hypothetical protein
MSMSRRTSHKKCAQFFFPGVPGVKVTTGFDTLVGLSKYIMVPPNNEAWTFAFPNHQNKSGCVPVDSLGSNFHCVLSVSPCSVEHKFQCGCQRHNEHSDKTYTLYCGSTLMFKSNMVNRVVSQLYCDWERNILSDDDLGKIAKVHFSDLVGKTIDLESAHGISRLSHQLRFILSALNSEEDIYDPDDP